MFQSTPKSRNRKRDNAVKIGKVQTFLSQQPVFIAAFVAVLLVAAFLEQHIITL